MEREDLEQLQLERLQSTLNRAYKNVPFYRKEFDELGIDPGALSSVQEITRLPFTTREDLGDNYPYGMFAMPLRDIVRISSSTGTTPKPVVVGYTPVQLGPSLERRGRKYRGFCDAHVSHEHFETTSGHARLQNVGAHCHTFLCHAYG